MEVIWFSLWVSVVVLVVMIPEGIVTTKTTTDTQRVKNVTRLTLEVKRASLPTDIMFACVDCSIWQVCA